MAYGESAAVAEDDVLRAWIGEGHAFAATLPSK